MHKHKLHIKKLVIVRKWLSVDYRRIKMQQFVLGLELGVHIGKVILMIVDEISKTWVEVKSEGRGK